MRTQERLAHPRPIAFETPATAPATRPGIAYRPALDGLRALAVLAVLGYHLELGWLPGGFLGVDVFFVLSGYLITTLLLTEHEATGRIALGAFWARRARRLLPALLLVLLAVAVWERATAPTFELPGARTDLLWALFYGSNWNLVASAQDYFAQFGSASLVRHTWSLAIEEQFYLLWPLVVLAALGLARARARALVAICATGIAVSVALMALLASGGDPSRAYYGTETRVHQLLIGALLGLLLARIPAGRRPRAGWGGAAAGASVFALIVAFATVGDASRAYYRGLSAAVALTVALLIWGLELAPRGIVGRALGTRPATGIGKISYGLYLWHWPVILAVDVPLAMLAWLPADLGLAGSRILFTFALAALSYRLVERPIREGSAPFMRGSLPRFAVAAGVATFALSLGIVSLTATPAEREFTPGARGLDEAGCELEICVRHRATAPDAPVVAVIGDSIARSIDPGMLDLARREDWTYVVAAGDGCRVTHLLTTVDGDSERYEECFETTPGLWRELLETWEPDLVIDIGEVELADIEDPSGTVLTVGEPEHLETERRALATLTKEFVDTGTRLAFVAFPPTVLPDECLRVDTGDLEACRVPASAERKVGPFNDALDEVASTSPGEVFVVSLDDYLCPEGLCSPTVDGVFVRYDDHHYTVEGARWIVPRLHDELVEAGALPASMS